MARAITTKQKLMWTILAWSFGLLMFFPIMWTFLTSFKTEAAAISDPPVWFFFDYVICSGHQIGVNFLFLSFLQFLCAFCCDVDVMRRVFGIVPCRRI